eukprot:TRINITY_DN22153_c0_g1_i1.p1 TRINITY_DN22153_c0_g1~~TRINITY_DN22153_c0_g1_i1.p1  ORF type:complete len:135 (+),score=6.05 TRINITY_DN22153_c0_g1_i1:99-503(+)
MRFLLFFICSMISGGSSLRCFTCRSDAQLHCDDPFYPGHIPVDECNDIHTFESHLCFKAQHYAGGKYITVRGCAPFDSEVFEPRMQRSMKGDYSGPYGNFISLCDSDNCNGARTIGQSGFTLFAALACALAFFL